MPVKYGVLLVLPSEWKEWSVCTTKVVLATSKMFVRCLWSSLWSSWCWCLQSILPSNTVVGKDFAAKDLERSKAVHIHVCMTSSGSCAFSYWNWRIKALRLHPQCCWLGLSTLKIILKIIWPQIFRVCDGVAVTARWLFRMLILSICAFIRFVKNKTVTSQMRYKSCHDASQAHIW